MGRCTCTNDSGSCRGSIECVTDDDHAKRHGGRLDFKCFDLVNHGCDTLLLCIIFGVRRGKRSETGDRRCLGSSPHSFTIHGILKFTHKSRTIPVFTTSWYLEMTSNGRVPRMLHRNVGALSSRQAARPCTAKRRGPVPQTGSPCARGIAVGVPCGLWLLPRTIWGLPEFRFMLAQISFLYFAQLPRKFAHATQHTQIPSPQARRRSSAQSPHSSPHRLSASERMLWIRRDEAGIMGGQQSKGQWVADDRGSGRCLEFRDGPVTNRANGE